MNDGAREVNEALHRVKMEQYARRQIDLLESIEGLLTSPPDDPHPYAANRAQMGSDRQRCLVCGEPDGPPNHPEGET